MLREIICHGLTKGERLWRGLVSIAHAVQNREPEHYCLATSVWACSLKSMRPCRHSIFAGDFYIKNRHPPLLTLCLRRFRVGLIPPRSPRKPLHYNTLSSSHSAPAGLTVAFGGHARCRQCGTALSTNRRCRPLQDLDLNILSRIVGRAQKAILGELSKAPHVYASRQQENSDPAIVGFAIRERLGAEAAFWCSTT